MGRDRYPRDGEANDKQPNPSEDVRREVGFRRFFGEIISRVRGRDPNRIKNYR